MNDHTDHANLVKSFYESQKDIFENSPQSVYVFLDDESKICNKNFATLLGFDSEVEWSKVGGNFLEAFVADKSQELLASTYQSAMENLTGAKIAVTWKKKSGGTVDTNVLLVPVLHEGHAFALHFISKI